MRNKDLENLILTRHKDEATGNPLDHFEQKQRGLLKEQVLL